MKQLVLFQFKTELAKELDSILSFWSKYTVDEDNGGFYGSVSNDNIPDTAAPKGIVLYSRILWTFSSAYGMNPKPEYLGMAKRAYEYILNFFIDKKFGGVYWSVDEKGHMLDGKKQIYRLGFCIYGLSEYYKISNDEEALEAAIALYNLVESKSFDKEQNGYVEAYARDWSGINDLRLSEKDNNERKTMNTHLHIVEGYANLFAVWPDDTLRKQIENLLWLFLHYFFNNNNHHYNLFFDDEWNLKSSLQSYGHDIEAAWLLQQCAELIKHDEHIETFRRLAVPVAAATNEGLDKDGGLWYEFEPGKNLLITEKHSWPQAEAMIGFYNAYQLTGNENYLRQSLHSWEFVKRYIKDNQNGEWYWGVNQDYSVMNKDKAGFWKCPYHNSRACMELMGRIAY
ncbi:MAG: AGE family epimerase/isomerase [Chitinophagaceae bacterium]|nr:AGE family epimerase/isomerase [Chitinophagaceae bacterium]